jgi:hypothetical protein
MAMNKKTGESSHPFNLPTLKPTNFNYSSTHLPREFDRGTQHLLDHVEIYLFRLRVADATFSEVHAFTFQQLFVGLNHIFAKDVQANEVLVAGEAHLHHAFPRVAGSTVLHRLLETGQGGAAQVAQLFQRGFPLGGDLFQVGSHGFGRGLHVFTKTLRDSESLRVS